MGQKYQNPGGYPKYCKFVVRFMAGIYFHIPFCKQACYYCDFHFSTNLSLKRDLLTALAHETEIQRSYLQEPVDTVYFGGGTPSLADPAEIGILLQKVRSVFQVEPDAEITLEANPDDLTPLKLQGLRDEGVNRLSIGIQSFDERVLRFLNRAHDHVAARNCIPIARGAGFSNISIDLIYAIPGQSYEQWKNNVTQAIALEPEHISAYSLTIEEKTVFGNWSAKGKLVPVGDDLSAEQFDLLIDLLEKAGYEHYEISNFARPGFQSRHNSSYWKQEKYLGIGPSAHSYNGVSRQFNVANNYQYVSAIREERVPFTIEQLSRVDQVNDYLLTTLRTSWGTDLARLRDIMEYDLLETRKTYIEALIRNGYAVVAQDHLVLTRKGKFLADKISSDLFLTN